MDSAKQKLLIEYLISSPDTFALCQGIVEPEYFDPEFRHTVKFVKDYFGEYNATPEPRQIKAETGVDVERQNVGKDELEYCSNEIEKFCKRRAMEKAILGSVAMINGDDFGNVLTTVRDALLVSLNRDLGLRYFDDPQARLDRMSIGNYIEPTGWKEIDELLFGGPGRKEMLLVSAGPGGGKSICLANLGFNFIDRGLDALYISLELSEDVIAQRFDTMFTGISRKDWKQHVSEIAVRVSSAKEGKGHLDIKQFPSGTTQNQLLSYLKEYHLFYGKMPDLLIIDYLDLMNPNEKIDLSDIWVKDKLVSEQIRDIAVQYNLIVATASQLNRSAVKATQHDHSQIAGGISKINTTDVYWSILFNDAQRAKGEIAFVLQKTRNSDGVGKTVYLKWDAKHLRILDREDGGDKLAFVRKDRTKTFKDDIISELPTGNGLEKLMSFNR
jgi:archaellum biogenesis ATPase FlaH